MLFIKCKIGCRGSSARRPNSSCLLIHNHHRCRHGNAYLEVLKETNESIECLGAQKAQKVGANTSRTSPSIYGHLYHRVLCAAAFAVDAYAWYYIIPLLLPSPFGIRPTSRPQNRILISLNVGKATRILVTDIKQGLHQVLTVPLQWMTISVRPVHSSTESHPIDKKLCFFSRNVTTSSSLMNTLLCMYDASCIISGGRYGSSLYLDGAWL